MSIGPEKGLRGAESSIRFIMAQKLDAQEEVIVGSFKLAAVRSDSANEQDELKTIAGEHLPASARACPLGMIALEKLKPRN
jgi:hypothetical protein